MEWLGLCGVLMTSINLLDEDIDVIAEALECLIGQYHSSFFTQDMETTIRVDKRIDCMRKNLTFFNQLKQKNQAKDLRKDK
jgi:hypothetical protein